MSKPDFRMEFDIGTIRHLGLQMYSTLPPVISELVSNAWDADAERVEITIPTQTLDEESEIVVLDDGSGMSDHDVRNAYLIVGRDRRKEDDDALTPIHHRKVMGRKGIGKFSAFGIAGEIEVETAKTSSQEPRGRQTTKPEISRWVMSLAELSKRSANRVITMPAMEATGKVRKGTRVIMRCISKYRTRRINIDAIRSGLARRFSIIGSQQNFEVVVNGDPITPSERNLQRLLDVDVDGNPYLWLYENEEIQPETGWTVFGWIGALKRTVEDPVEAIQRGIVLMARGKLVQEPFVFDAVVGQQFALSYLVGELHADFVDEGEDTIATTRNSLVWDSEANAALLQWGKNEVNKIARQWADKRQKDNERVFLENPVYLRFTEEAKQFDDKQVKKIAEKFVKGAMSRNLVADPKEQQAELQSTVQLCLEYMQFDSFKELANELTEAKLQDIPKVIELFRTWEIVEAKEMMRVTEGRISTIEKLQQLIKVNALEVPILHNFLREFPWVLDPKWTLIADEVRYSELLRQEYPELVEVPEEEKRIDFLCVRENDSLIVVEIKRPKSRASIKEFNQIEGYVGFMREHIRNTNDPEYRFATVTGYLLVGDIVGTGQARQKRDNLEKAGIYVRRYEDLLSMVEKNHKEFLTRYEALRTAKKAALALSDSPTLALPGA